MELVASGHLSAGVGTAMHDAFWGRSGRDARHQGGSVVGLDESEDDGRPLDVTGLGAPPGRWSGCGSLSSGPRGFPLAASSTAANRVCIHPAAAAIGALRKGANPGG